MTSASLSPSGHRSDLGIKVISLQSGSNGNCWFIEAGGTAIVIDAGISGAMAEARLAEHGKYIRSASALVITHEHSDHMRSAGVFQRKFGLQLHCTAGTLSQGQKRMNLGRMGSVSILERGRSALLGPLTIETIRTPHDAHDPIALVISYDGSRLGLMTDLGHAFPELRKVIGTLDAVIIESNYDEEMLKHGPYPEYLKARIRGSHGHLSNEESAALVRDSASSRLRWACLAHLSETNNTPAKALAAHRKASRGDYEIRMASRYEAVRIS